MVVDTTVRLDDLGIRDPVQLRSILAHAAGVTGVLDAEVAITEVPYDIPALTTRGRYRVHGTARTEHGDRTVSVFVKVVQSWALSPLFANVPPEHRAAALAQLPWKIEPLVYGSALAGALPEGMRMPQVYAVIDLGPDAAAIWMEDVQWMPHRWTYADYTRAATGLGRFATSTQVAAAIEPIRRTVGAPTVRDYVQGRVAMQVLPALHDPGLWQHPLVSRHFAAHRERLLDLAERLPTLLSELETLPVGLGHGDACTRNLLTACDGTLVVIDFGFVRYAPLGVDLGQLVLGEIQLGERSPDDLVELWSTCLAAYATGVRRECGAADLAELGRAAALCMAIFAGVSVVPLELLGEPPASAIDRIFAHRAKVAALILDLVDHT